MHVWGAWTNMKSKRKVIYIFNSDLNAYSATPCKPPANHRGLWNASVFINKFLQMPMNSMVTAVSLCYVSLVSTEAFLFSVSSVFLISATFKKGWKLPCKKTWSTETEFCLSHSVPRHEFTIVRKSGSSFLKEIHPIPPLFPAADTSSLHHL